MSNIFSHNKCKWTKSPFKKQSVKLDSKTIIESHFLETGPLLIRDIKLFCLVILASTMQFNIYVP